MSKLPPRLFAILLLVALALAFSDAARPVVAEDTGSISGVVYSDTDMDGERDDGEPPVAGRTVELRWGEDYERVRTTESGPDGRYRFDDLSKNISYEVVLLADSQTFCITNEGCGGLSGDQDWTDIDLSLVQKGHAVITGAVIDDQNESESYDPGEPGIEGLQVELSSESWDCSVRSVTTADGSFEFRDIPHGRYIMDLLEGGDNLRFWEVTFPTSLLQSSLLRSFDGRLDLTDKDELDLKIGGHYLSGRGSISGALFVDADLDKVRDEEEALGDCLWTYWFRLGRRLPSGSAVFLAYGLSPYEDSCRDGHFEVKNLPAGIFLVALDVIPWCGEISNNRWVTLSEGQRVENVDLVVCRTFSPPTPQPPSLTATPPVPPPVPLLTPLPSSTAGPDSLLVAPPATGVGDPPSSSDLALLIGASIALAIAGASAVCGSLLLARRRSDQP